MGRLPVSVPSGFPPLPEGTDRKREARVWIYSCDYCGDTLRWETREQYLSGVPIHVLQECQWMHGINRDMILKDWALAVAGSSHWEPPLF